MANQLKQATFAVDNRAQLTSRIASMLREVAAERATVAAERSAKASVEAQTRLKKCGYPLLHNVGCETKDDVLYLTGRVPSFYLKQLAQTFVRDVPGIAVVVNNLRVNDK